MNIMMFPLEFIFLLGIAQNLLGDEIFVTDGGDISSGVQKDLTFCYPIDSCVEERSDDSPGIKFPYKCSCDSQCFKLGTCCVDSPYRVNSPPTQKCRSAYIEFTSDDNGSGYSMVHRCPDNTDSNSMWKDLCEKEWDHEDDIVKLAPVTSLDTSTTYVNYYCLRCHETTNDLLYWNLRLTGEYSSSQNVPKIEDLSVSYSEINGTWVGEINEDDVSFPVYLEFLVPEKLPFSLIRCDPFMASDCPDRGTNEDTRNKCSSYTGIVYGRYGKYKNVHCALCNNESLNDITCDQKGGSGGWGGGGSGPNFRYTIDISSSGRNGNMKSCAHGEFWNPYQKKCKKVSCVIPGYVPKNGKCAPP